MANIPSVDYGLLVPIDIHFDQLDPYHVVYHTHYLTLIDRAMHAHWNSKGLHAADEENGPDSFQLVREVTITYERPIRRDGRVWAHVWVESVGTTSYTHGFRLLSPDGTKQYAHGKRVLIKVDPSTQRPAPWSDEARAVLGELLCQPALVSTAMSLS
ncbi:acyl-CoA thioesterase [Actinoplanes sp. NPDC051343]|uniref:acyl-CoA thioesterase n=1 Tax=Actinoplanes sp. NPDC051343 TaxID=3363906 RepID=UPI0037971AE3